MTAALSLTQLESIRDSDGRVNVWDGSIRSGKTYSSWLRFLAHVATYEGIGSLAIIGKSRDTIYRNLFEPIEQDDSLEFLRAHVHYRQNAPTAKIFGRTIAALSANDNRSEPKIRGMTLGGVYGDEITTWPEDVFKQTLGRMSPAGAKFFGTTNPDNPRHWLKRDYLDRLRELPHWRRFHFTMDDNPSLTDEYKDAVKADYTGLWYRRFILGDWVSAEGAIYDRFDHTPRSGHVVPWAELPPMRQIITIGIDVGTTNATSAIMLGLSTDPRPCLYLIDEWRYQSSATNPRLTNQEQAARIIEWADQPHLPHQPELRTRFTHGDPAAADFRETMRKQGRTVWKAENTVVDGIQLMSSLFASRQLLVSDRCTGFLDEVSGYMWDGKQSENGFDVPVKRDDHSLDAARYAVASTYHVWRKHLPEGVTNAAE